MGRFGDLTQSEGFAWGEKMVCLKHLRAGGKKHRTKAMFCVRDGPFQQDPSLGKRTSHLSESALPLWGSS